MGKRMVGIFQGYSIVDTADSVRTAFLDRFGYEPEIVKFHGGVILAGPIEGQTELRPGERQCTGEFTTEEEER